MIDRLLFKKYPKTEYFPSNLDYSAENRTGRIDLGASFRDIRRKFTKLLKL